MTVYLNGVAVAVAPAPHESTHVSGGSDDIDSALAVAAIPNLATSKITSTRFPVARLPAMTDEKIWKGTGGDVEEIDVPAGEAATKEFFVPFLFGEDGATHEAIGMYNCWLIDAANECAYTTFRVPHDFTSLISAKIIYLGKKESSGYGFDWTVTTYFCENEAAHNEHTDSVTENASVMANNIRGEFDITEAFTGIVADDAIGLKLLCDVVSAQVGCRLLEVVFKYS